MVLLAIDLDMFGHGSAGQVLGRTDVDRVEYAHILYIPLKILFNFRCGILSLIRPLEMMVLLAIDLDMFGHGSAGQVLGRTDVDRVEYVRIGV
ncbi:hypothetical protein AtEden1_Chr4g0271661 [Arabidopsis thaliana]